MPKGSTRAGDSSTQAVCNKRARSAYYCGMRTGTPLFPLPTVLFPEGPLPLRVFEPRYVDMVGRCMRDDEPFGVIRVQEDAKSPSDVKLCKTGTLAIIADWFQSEGGLLGILVIGSLRFQLHATAVQPDGLRTGDIEELPPEPEVPLPSEYLSNEHRPATPDSEAGPPVPGDRTTLRRCQAG